MNEAFTEHDIAKTLAAMVADNKGRILAPGMREAYPGYGGRP